jgi:diadenylate cyclase
MQTLQDFFKSITWVNLLDIVILSGLIYYPLTWFARTRAVQILVILMGIGVAYFGALRAGLILTSYLFQYLWAAIIVLLVIVFQPEIRGMFDRAAPIRFLSARWRGASQPSPGQVEEVVKAASDLAKENVGALIVFQRSDGLDNLTLKGTELDAIISAEAIMTIFQKTSPLHDGAVVLLNDRIVSACCILPLSTDESLSQKFGTRHRAAIGITERSDAIVIVVSEERGEVLLAEHGQFLQFHTSHELGNALLHGLSQQPNTRKGPETGLVSRVCSNWHVKILSLASAVLFWFAMVGPRLAEVGMSVPIQYANLPAGMEITGKWVDRVDVRVRGSESALANLQPGSVRVAIDLSDLVSGLNFFRISEKNLFVPPGISIKQILPSDLHLKIETAGDETFGVRLSLVGEPSPGQTITLVPQKVRIRAQAAELRKIESVITHPVDWSLLSQKGKVVVPIRVKPDGLRIESINPSEVTVSIESPKG